jgi:hypothetical protein
VNAGTRQHTPGPWSVEGSYVHGPDGKRFLAVASDGEGQANARLISSAPDLLSAMESIAALEPSIMSKQAEEGFRYHTEEDAYRIHLAGLINQARAIARAAIAKATGGNAS